MKNQEIITIHSYINADAKECSYAECTIVMTRVNRDGEEFGLAFPMTKKEFPTKPEIGDQFLRTITIVPYEPH